VVPCNYSASASGRSKGILAVSAKEEIKKTKNASGLRKIPQLKILLLRFTI
jgi:hypothetical protein